MVECPACGKVMEHTGATPTHMSSKWWKEENYICRACGIKGQVETRFQGVLSETEGASNGD